MLTRASCTLGPVQADVRCGMHAGWHAYGICMEGRVACRARVEVSGTQAREDRNITGNHLKNTTAAIHRTSVRPLRALRAKRGQECSVSKLTSHRVLGQNRQEGW